MVVVDPTWVQSNFMVTIWHSGIETEIRFTMQSLSTQRALSKETHLFSYYVLLQLLLDMVYTRLSLGQ
jgi:hypothetical protein